MGLSNGERYAKVTWAIRALVKLGDELRNHRELDDYSLPMSAREQTTKFANLTDNLWHQFLGTKSNGAFWLFGGDHNNPLTDTTSPWAVAVQYHCESSKPESHFDKRIRGYFDPFDGHLDIPGLLPGEVRKKFYKAFAWSEQLAYALRRYQDKFLRSYPELDKSISDIQGLLFDVFQADREYTKAHVGNRILEALYKDNELREVFNKLYMHQDLSRFMVDCDLAEILAWDKWRLTHKPSKQNNVVLALRMAGRRFHYEHKLKELIKLTEGMGIRKKALRREFEKCKKAHGEKESENRDRYRGDAAKESAAFLHGFDAYDWFKKGEE